MAAGMDETAMREGYFLPAGARDAPRIFQDISGPPQRPERLFSRTMQSSLSTTPSKETTMNPNRQYKTTSPLLRSASGIAALTITLAVGAFIDTLAYHYGPDGAQARLSSPVVVARA
jgi:hypothetical protein